MHKLTDSFTLFLYDFKLKKNFREYPHLNNGALSFWKRSSIKPDESYLFNHVRDFFVKNTGESPVDENQCIIYELKKDQLSQEEKNNLFLFNHLFLKTHQLNYESKGENISFKLCNDGSVLSPKLFICPLSSVGIFSFVLRLGEESNTLENIINFNYKIRIFSAGQIVPLTTPANSHPGAAIQEKKIAEILINSGKNQSTPAHHEWDMRVFVNYFLKDFTKGSIEEISPARIQAFTYVHPEKKLTGDELDFALFRLRRMYNYNYMPSRSFIENNDETAQTFDQIYYGASVEGAVILLNEEKDKLPAFLKNYSEVLKGRNIWTYLLAYHQRIALIVAAEEVASLYEPGKTPLYDELAWMIKKLTAIQLKCMFNEISHYTQQNDFYYLCCQTLRLPPLFEELKEELNELNRNLGEEWHKQEKETSEKKAEADKKRDQRIAILVGMLVVPQVWLALLAMNLGSWQEFIKVNQQVFMAITCLLGIILVVVAGVLFLHRKK